MTKDIETVILPKCSQCKEVIQNPHEGYIVVGDIYTAELGSDGEPHHGLVGASFPTPSEDYAITLREQGQTYKFGYDDVHRHCFCQTCMMEILKIPHRPIPRPGLRRGEERRIFDPDLVEITPGEGPGVETAEKIRGRLRPRRSASNAFAERCRAEQEESEGVTWRPGMDDLDRRSARPVDDAVDEAFEKMRRDTAGQSPIEFDE